MADPAPAALADDGRSELEHELTASMIQTTVEIARGLQILRAEVRVWANRQPRAQRELAESLDRLDALVRLQDMYWPQLIRARS